MATPETNLTTQRANGEMNGNHNPHPPSSRHLQNFNTFQFVSQLVSATPPYLFNMSTPFPGNFFSDLLRRMAPRAGATGLPHDANLQQHIRAALLSKGTPPLTLPHMPPPLDLAAIAAQQRQQHQQNPLPTSSQEKGLKRSLFADVAALSSTEEENSSKRPRLEEPKEERRDHPPPSDSIASNFLMQSPFLSSTVPPTPDLMAPWTARTSLMRPQLPIPSHVPPSSLDPYRLLLDLRLAGQLRNMAVNQSLLQKDPSSIPPPAPPAFLSGSRASPINEGKKEDAPGIPSQPTTLRGDDSRVSAFHPPGRSSDVPVDTSDEDTGDHKNNDNVGTQYIFKHLTKIYRNIDGRKNDDDDLTANGESNVDHLHSRDVVYPSTELARPCPTDMSLKSAAIARHIADNSNNNKPGSINKILSCKDEPFPNTEKFSSSNGHQENRKSPPLPDESKTENNNKNRQMDR